MRAKEREEECQEEEWSNIIQQIQNANNHTQCSFCNNSMSNVLHYCYELGEYVLIDHKHCHVYNTKTKRVKDILDPKNNQHRIYQNRLDMAKDIQDIAEKNRKHEEKCAKDMRIKDMQERARKEQNKESSIKKETPKIIKKA